MKLLHCVAEYAASAFNISDCAFNETVRRAVAYLRLFHYYLYPSIEGHTPGHCLFEGYNGRLLVGLKYEASPTSRFELVYK